MARFSKTPLWIGLGLLVIGVGLWIYRFLGWGGSGVCPPVRVAEFTPIL